MPKLKLWCDTDKVLRVWMTLNAYTLELPRVASVVLETMSRFQPGNERYRAEIEFNDGGCTIILADCDIHFGEGLRAIDFFESEDKYIAET